MAAMGNAVLSLSVRHQTCGFACLVDTTPQFKQRLPKDQMHIEPADVPSPPIAPTREEWGDKSVMNLYKCNLNKCRKAVHIKTIRFALFSEVFPDCSASIKGPLGFPPDFHLKDAQKEARSCSTTPRSWFRSPSAHQSHPNTNI